MYFAVLIGFIVAALYARKWLAKADALSARVRLMRTAHIPVSASAARSALRVYLSRRGFILRESDDIMDAFLRGDTSIRRLPMERNVSWHEVPVIVTAGVGDGNGEAVVCLRFDSFPGVVLSPVVRETFCELAAAECGEAVAFLESLTGDREPEARASEPEAHVETRDPLETDLAALGLSPGASMADVQAAYRKACLKYHPDRLTGRQVDPHLIELASRRFTEVSSAYRRLREHLGQPQHV